MHHTSKDFASEGRSRSSVLPQMTDKMAPIVPFGPGEARPSSRARIHVSEPGARVCRNVAVAIGSRSWSI